jgi:hypothetical protein
LVLLPEIKGVLEHHSIDPQIAIGKYDFFAESHSIIILENNDQDQTKINDSALKTMASAPDVMKTSGDNKEPLPPTPPLSSERNSMNPHARAQFNAHRDSSEEPLKKRSFSSPSSPKENETDHSLQLDTSSPKENETDHSLQLDTISHHIAQPPVQQSHVQPITQQNVQPGPGTIVILPIHTLSFHKNYGVQDIKSAIAKAHSPLVVEGETLRLHDEALVKSTILCSTAKLSFIPDHNFDKTNQDHEIEHCDHESS